MAATAPPAPYTATRTLTLTIYTAPGKAPYTMVTEGSYSLLHGSERAASFDVADRLHLPVKPK